MGFSTHGYFTAYSACSVLVAQVPRVVYPDSLLHQHHMLRVAGAYHVRIAAAPGYTAGATAFIVRSPIRLTNRWSQPLAVVKSKFNFMKQLSILATLAPASGGSAPSR